MKYFFSFYSSSPSVSRPKTICREGTENPEPYSTIWEIRHNLHCRETCIINSIETNATESVCHGHGGRRTSSYIAN